MKTGILVAIAALAVVGLGVGVVAAQTITAPRATYGGMQGGYGGGMMGGQYGGGMMGGGSCPYQGNYTYCQQYMYEHNYTYGNCPMMG